MYKKFAALFLFLLVYCSSVKKNDSTIMTDIDKYSWIIYEDNEISPWRKVIMPIILSFNEGLLITNFSNYKYNYSIKNDKIYVDGVPSFTIKEGSDKDHLTITNDNGTAKYRPVGKGKENATTKELFDKILSENVWLYEKYDVQYLNHLVSLRDHTGNFVRGGSYSTHLYNGVIVFIITLDGDFSAKKYKIVSFDAEEIILQEFDYYNTEVVFTRKN